MPLPVTILQVPVTVANAFSRTLIEHIRRRNVAVLVREILASQITGNTWSPRDAISAAIVPDFVTAAIVGVSTRRHLNELLSGLS
jgi:hypothetical protein